MESGSLILFILLVFVSCTPVYMKHRYYYSTIIERVDVSFEKETATERREILLPCEEKYFIEKKATYKKVGNGMILIDSVVGFNMTDQKGRIVKCDSVLNKNICLDSIINEVIISHNKRRNVHKWYMDVDREYIIENELFLRSYLVKNDTIRYDRNFPKYISNDNGIILSTDSAKLDTSALIRFIHVCYGNK